MKKIFFNRKTNIVAFFRVLIALLCVFLVLTPSLTACSSDEDNVIVITDKNSGDQDGNAAHTSSDLDDSTVADTSSSETPEEQMPDGHHYILNTSSKKMHLASCASVSKISDANRLESDDSYYALLGQGYSPCTVCLKTPPLRDPLDTASDRSEASNAASSGAVDSSASDADSSSASSDVSADSDALPDEDSGTPTLPVESHYILNTSSKKIHLSSCNQAARIQEKNRAESNETLAELLAKGYTTCGICLKDAGKAPMTPDDPDENTTGQDTATGVKYILNTSSKKFHLPSCSSAVKITDKNRAESKESAAELQQQGYSPCGICKPA